MSSDPRSTHIIEQRLQERFSMQLPVKVFIEASNNGREVQFESVTANISSGGAFITTDTPLPVSAKVSLEFLISIEELQKLKFVLSLETLRRFENKPVWVMASGVIIRHESKGMAIIFDDDYQLSPMQGAAK